MAIPLNVRALLDRKAPHYEILLHPRTHTLGQAAQVCNIPLSRMVRAVVLVDGKGLLMAVLPADHVLDFSALCEWLHRDLELVPGNRLGTIFEDCEPGSYPPVGAAYQLDVILDEAVEAMASVHFEPGTHTTLIQMSCDNFRQLLGNPLTGRFSRPASELKAEPAALPRAVEQFTPARVKPDIEEFHELPALPATAVEILQLAEDPRANARQLARIIEQDPALSAQVLRYANSPLYGYVGRIDNLQTAIARVLGFDFVLNLALGFSIGSSLRIPQDGPFGMEAFWRHAVYAARLVESLSRRLPRDIRPSAGSAYLAGLLQNLGRLVLGHTFEPEFFVLNRFSQANPDMPTCELERQVLGVTHDRIGAWLMQAWGLPDTLCIAARHHHDPDYWERHAIYPQLVLIANRALAAHGLGEPDTAGLPDFSLEMLGLNTDTVWKETDKLLKIKEILDALADRLAA